MIPKENCALNLRDPDNKQITVKTEKPILIEQTQESTPSIFRFLTSLLGTVITVLTALIVYVQTFTENDDAEKIPRNKIVPDISLVDDSCQTYTINANGSEKAIQTTNMMQSFSTTFHNDNEQDTLKQFVSNNPFQQAKNIPVKEPTLSETEIDEKEPNLNETEIEDNQTLTDIEKVKEDD